MDFLFKGLNEASNCSFNEKDIQRCPFLRNIDKPTNFAFSSVNFPVPVKGASGPIFEDGPNFDMAYKVFHGKDGVVPLSGPSHFHSGTPQPQPSPQFNPLAAKAATISLSAFGPGGPFSFDSFSEKWKMLKKKHGTSKKSERSHQGDSSKHEAMGNEWLETGNCPIAKSYRAVSGDLPLVAKALQPPPGIQLKCPPAIVAARATLARTALVKTLRPQPLSEKMLVIGVLGMAANVPLGIWREHTRKFSLSWFIAVHAAVPFIAMLRKSVLMPKTAMPFTIAASVLGQVIGSRAERLRLKANAERETMVAQTASASAAIAGYKPGNIEGSTYCRHCSCVVDNCKLRLNYHILSIAEGEGVMDFLFKGLNEASNCSFNEKDIQRCPFLRNIDKPTNFAFSSVNFPVPVKGASGPIFEDGPNFDMAYKVFHGKDGVVPLSGPSHFHSGTPQPQPSPQFNPLAAKAATISLSAFGPGGPFSFDSFSEKWKMLKKKHGTSKKSERSHQGDSSKHEAMGNEWLETGNCPIAKSYRAVSGDLPLVAKALQPPPGIQLKCPPAIVAARATLARTALVKTLRPQPLSEKMLVIGVLGMAANVPLGIWREHTRKFSLSWFIAVHAAVPFIAMLRKSVLMPKTAMPFTIAASVLGQVIGSRAERLRLKANAERETMVAQTASASAAIAGYKPGNIEGSTYSSANVCF